MTEYFLFDFLFPLYTLSSSFVTRCYESLFSSGRKIPLRDTFEQTPYILLTPCCPRIFHKLYCFREFRRGRGGGEGELSSKLSRLLLRFFRNSLYCLRENSRLKLTVFIDAKKFRVTEQSSKFSISFLVTIYTRRREEKEKEMDS